MKKRLLLSGGIVLLLLLIGGYFVAGPGTSFSAPKQYLYIATGAANQQAVMDSLKKNGIVSNPGVFSFIAGRLGVWEAIKPGRYEIEKGSSLLSIARKLRNGVQSAVSFTIVKYRTKEDFARSAGRKFEFDSADMMDFLSNPNSLRRYGADSATAMALVLPDTYAIYWNSSPAEVFARLVTDWKKYWTEERTGHAKALGLTPFEAVTLASIVEEETNKADDKDTIASVYLNRVKKGMRLAADPTLKYAIRDFGATWIHGPMLKAESPYNTYLHAGWPPGPICTPSKKTIDETLKAPATNYLFFVASYKFDGSSLFSATFEEHLQKARAYQAEDKRRREERAIRARSKPMARP